MSQDGIKKSYRERYEQIADRFRLMDDDFMTLVFGDNLEVLKLLQESYLGKVKMIYIDIYPAYLIQSNGVVRECA